MTSAFCIAPTVNRRLPFGESEWYASMTHDERLALFRRDLQALMHEDDAMVIFNLAGDEDRFVQYSHRAANEPLLCEVSNRSEAGSARAFAPEQVAPLAALGYEIPSPHHQANPHKESDAAADALAEETEHIFRRVYNAPEDYAVESSGVVW